MDERLQFVARRLAGEQMADLCREFGISRKTGYKIFDRYHECGVQGLRTAAGAPITMRTSCLSKSRTTS
jgi:transposase